MIDSTLCYIPLKRTSHNSVIIDNRLLIFGGYLNLDDLFYLDLSSPFYTANLSWTLIEGNLPIYEWDSASVVGLDNSTIYLIGGWINNKDTKAGDFSELVRTYDYSKNTWNVPEVTGDFTPKQQIGGVIDNSGIIYIFGGLNATGDKIAYNDMNLLNTTSMTWTTLNLKNRPRPCSFYSAIILPSGIIVYIGGREDSGGTNLTLVKMSNVGKLGAHNR